MNLEKGMLFMKKCPSCNGSGNRVQRFSEGYITSSECYTCKGIGYVDDKKSK